MAIGAGAAFLFIATCVLKTVHAYSFPAIITILAATISLGVWRSPNLRRELTRPWRALTYDFIPYLAGVIALYVMMPIDQYDQLQGTTIYLQQGFDLFLSRDPAEIPHFGRTFVAPVAYLGLPISAVFGFFSHNDAFLYYAFGEYWENIIIGPTILLGSYLTLRRLFPWWAALAGSSAFCFVALDVKIWSLRGESLAWIIGFAFLLGFFDLLEAVKRRAPMTELWRPLVVLGVLYAELGLTHGVTAFTVTCFLTGFTVFDVLGAGNLRRLTYVCRVGGLFTCVAVTAYVGFPHLISAATPGITASWNSEREGEPDPAVDFDIALGYLPGVHPPAVHAAPPYVDPVRLAKVVMAVPLAATFRPGFDHFPIEDFPDSGFAHLQMLTRLEARTYVVLLLACMALQSLPMARKIAPLRRATFWGAVGVCIMIILLAVYLDYRSVSRFPLSGVRREFIYVRCFYFLAVVSTVFDFILYFISKHVKSYFDKASAWLMPWVWPPRTPVIVVLSATVMFITTIGFAIRSKPAFVVDFWSPQPARTKLYFDHGAGFSEADSVAVQVPATKCAGDKDIGEADRCSPSLLRFPLPPAVYSAFRLDVTVPQGTTFLQNTRVVGADGKEIRRFSLGAFVHNDLTSVRYLNDGIAVSTTSGDHNFQLLVNFANQPLQMSSYPPIRLLFRSLMSAGLPVTAGLVLALAMLRIVLTFRQVRRHGSGGDAVPAWGSRQNAGWPLGGSRPAAIKGFLTATATEIALSMRSQRRSPARLSACGAASGTGPLPGTGPLVDSSSGSVDRRSRIGRESIWVAMAAAFFFVTWLDLSTQPRLSHAITFESLWARREDPLGNRFFDELEPLFDAVRYVRDRTAVGDLVFTNLFSEDTFWFLSSGRYATLDGVAMYNLTDVQRPAIRRIRLFRKFLETADLSLVADYDFKYLLLYRKPIYSDYAPDLVNYGDPQFVTNFSAFAANQFFKQVYANPYYVILRRLDKPD
jgi:hypothetical protein